MRPDGKTARRGTLRRFLGDGPGAVVSIEQESGNVASLLVHPLIAERFATEHGVESDGVLDLSSVIGRRIEYVESATGVIVRLTVADSAEGM